MQKNTLKSTIQTLKTQVSLADHIRAAGVNLKSHGKDLIGHCPFHNDKTPSLVVTPAKNLFRDFGACNFGGSIIDWEMKMHNISRDKAIEKLKEQYSYLFNGNGRGTPRSVKEEQLKNKVITAAELLEKQEAEQQEKIEEIEREQILKRCIDYFHRILKQTPNALNYLQSRGLVHPDMIEEFQLGYADNSFLSKLPSGREGTELRKKLKQIGLLSESGRLIFNGCIVFPIFDKDGNILNIYGRRITERKDYSNHIYMTELNGLFNHKALISREIILAESVIDALSFWVHGFKNVTCSYGANGYIKKIPELFTDAGVERVYLAYDNDKAGNGAVETITPLLAEHGMEVYKIEFPVGLDANAYIQRVKSPADSLSLLLQAAPLLSDFLPAKGGNDIALFNDLLQKNAVPDNKNNGTSKNDVSAKVLSMLEKKDGAWFYSAGTREYKLLGLEKNTSAEALKVYLKVTSNKKFHLDNNIDLYTSKDRKAFIKNAAEELELDLEVIKKDVSYLISLAEEKQTDLILQSQKKQAEEKINITEQERQDAIAYLKDPQLVHNIMNDFKRCGIVGEEENILNAYIAATSRKEDRPLAVVIQSSSGAGKTTVMDAILNFMPEEDVVKFSAMTGQSLFYMGEKNLKNKILAIVEEEGAEKASYSLKVLQSEGKISIASTGKDPESGRMVTQEYIVEGPVMLIITTTNYDIDEELLNRCIVLTINESREQTKLIHKIQRYKETLDGMFMDLDTDNITRLHNNCQRLLRKIRVHNPFAKYLTFNDINFKSRRDQLKYLTLIRTITLLHQYQREVKTTVKNSRVIEYIETTLEDIELANRLAGKIFGSTLDELPPQTRSILNKIYDYVKLQCKLHKIEQEDYRFTRREIREHLNTGLTQLRVHINRLIDYEYLVIHKGRKGQSFVYELVYFGEGEKNLQNALGLFNTNNIKRRQKTKT